MRKGEKEGHKVAGVLGRDRDLGAQVFEAQQRVGWGPRALRHNRATAPRAARTLLDPR